MGPEFPEWIALREPITSIQDLSGVPAYVTPFSAVSLFDVSDLLHATRTKVIDPDQLLKQPEWW